MCIFNMHSLFSVVPVVIVVGVVAVVAVVVIALVLYYSTFHLEHNTMILIWQSFQSLSVLIYWYKFIGDLVSIIARCKYTQFHCSLVLRSKCMLWAWVALFLGLPPLITCSGKPGNIATAWVLTNPERTHDICRYLFYLLWFPSCRI